MATVNLGHVKGTTWYKGTGITGDSTEATVFPSSGVEYAITGDWYVNTGTAYVYICETSGDASNATWVFFMDLNTIAQDAVEDAEAYATGYRDGVEVT